MLTHVHLFQAVCQNGQWSNIPQCPCKLCSLDCVQKKSRVLTVIWNFLSIYIPGVSGKQNVFNSIYEKEMFS